MTITHDCEWIAEQLEAYLERTLSPNARLAFENHLKSCEACGRSVHFSNAVNGLVAYIDAASESSTTAHAQRSPSTAVLPDVTADSAADAHHPSLSVMDRLGAAPWWFVSCALHVLVIALAGLVTMAIDLPRPDDGVVMLTELQSRPTVQADEEKKTEPADNALDSKHDTPPTDPHSKDVSDIVVPPDILAKADLGDHFETINPDLPDTHSALGNPDARMFHSVTGNTEAAGGGGTGGLGMEDVIGIGGSASRGTGGGFGGGDGTGVGVGQGAGHGSFGSRTGGGRKLMVARHGGSRATENAVDKALHWLAYHQEADGHWDVVKYSGEKGGDTALTGLALLAFLGAGHTEKIGGYKDNVKRGIEWLRAKQKSNGCLASGGETCGYNHAMAGLALAEAAGMARIPETMDAAQKAVDYSVNVHQCGEGSEKMGWRYTPKEKGDISNSGWFIMQLKSAKVAGLKIPFGAFEGASAFLDTVEDKTFAADANNAYDNGRHRYGYVSSSKTEVIERPMRSAIGCLCREFMGASREELAGGVEWFMNTKGQRGGGLPTKSDVNLYYWYYGTLCTFQQGGDLWKRWNDALKPALVETQRNDGDDAGSWDPEKTSGPGNPFGSMWGRVGQTAFSALCLEVYYRYMLLR